MLHFMKAKRSRIEGVTVLIPTPIHRKLKKDAVLAELPMSKAVSLAVKEWSARRKYSHARMREDIIASMKTLLGSGYVDSYYEESAADFINIAREYAGEQA